MSDEIPPQQPKEAVGFCFLKFARSQDDLPDPDSFIEIISLKAHGATNVGKIKKSWRYHFCFVRQRRQQSQSHVLSFYPKEKRNRFKKITRFFVASSLPATKHILSLTPLTQNFSFRKKSFPRFLSPQSTKSLQEKTNRTGKTKSTLTGARKATSKDRLKKMN